MFWQFVCFCFLFSSTCFLDGALTETKTANQLGYDPESIHALVSDAIDWAHEVFLVLRVSGQKHRSDRAQFVPFSLFPSPIPRKMYEQALSVQKAMSLLYFRIASDFDFLKMAYKDVIESDKSVRTLLGILEDIKKEGIKQPISIFLQRSDYMITAETNSKSNQPNYQLKQIEVNGGSIGSAGCQDRLLSIHQRVLKHSGCSDQMISNALPENRAGAAIAEIIYKAWKLLNDPRAIILFVVVKDLSTWHFSKRYDEYELERLSGGRAKIVHLTTVECFENLKLDDDFTLRLDGRPIGVAYWNIVRLGDDTFGHKSLAALRMIERSTAIKATSLFFELSTSKKIQQLLVKPGMVERFFTDPSEQQMVAAIRATFAKLWGLENNDEETQKIIQDAIAHPERYVLKPNKEGGGGNIWGEEISQKLSKFSRSELAAHILMERINPVTVKNFMVWPFKRAEFAEVINELGIYGYLIGNVKTGEVLEYEQPGNMVRTKNMHNNEGGVSSGNGVLDTPFLY
ncbi:hypothetical protein niasHS_002948 [Heterodera schachtii]|uniref:Glutathione synthetase n=1 Tax=Heterodera schachtii TaxID=97005 RepID=A0ABD2K9H5_HETSC